MPSPVTTTPRPDLDLLVEDFDLTGNQSGFVGLQIMPLMPVARQNGRFPKLTAKEVLKVVTDNSRRPGAGFERISFNFETDTYDCEEFGLEGQVDKDTAAIYGEYVNAESVTSKIVLNNQLTHQEIRIRDLVYANANTGAGSDWSVGTNSARDDIHTRSQTIKDATGIRPDSLKITWSKFYDVMRLNEFLETTKYTGNPFSLGFDAQKALVSQYLNVKNVLVADGIQDTASKGLAVSSSSIWDDSKAFLFVSGNFAETGMPQYGMTMDYGAGVAMNASYYEPQTKSDIIQVSHYRDEKVQLEEAGFLLTGL
jgi:hypothetical protein